MDRDDHAHAGELTIVDASLETCKAVKYEAVQFHWHTPSEHTFSHSHGGKELVDVELHIVHMMKGEYVEACSEIYRELLVLGVAFAESKTPLPVPKITPSLIILATPKIPPRRPPALSSPLTSWTGSTRAPTTTKAVSPLTPTCGERVEWHVAKEVQKVGKDALNAITARLESPSKRKQAPEAQ